MPKLLIFVPSEKVILDTQGNISLITVMSNVSAMSRDNAEFPKNAVAPKEWSVFTMWQPMPGDEHKKWVETIEILWPDGTEFKKISLPFEMQKDTLHHNNVTIIGFPLGQTGPLTLNMWLEEDSRRVGEVHSYPLSVSHQKATA